MNAKLAEPMNTEENENIATELTGMAKFSRYWIGISDKETEGTFKYASDASEVEFTSWRSGQPNNRWPKLDCTAFKNGQWNTANCANRQLPYMCQMDISEDDDNTDNGDNDSMMSQRGMLPTIAELTRLPQYEFARCGPRRHAARNE